MAQRVSPASPPLWTPEWRAKLDRVYDKVVADGLDWSELTPRDFAYYVAFTTLKPSEDASFEEIRRRLWPQTLVGRLAMTMMLPYGILSGNPLVGEWKQSLDEGKGLFTGAGDGPYPSTTREEALIRAFLPPEAKYTLKYTKEAKDDAKRILYDASIYRIRELLPDWYEALTNQLLTGSTYVDNALVQVYAKLEDPKFAKLFQGPDILPVRKRLLGWFSFIKDTEVGIQLLEGKDKSLYDPVMVNVAVRSNPDDAKSPKLDFTAKDPPVVLLVPYSANIAGLTGLGPYATVWEYLMTAAVRSYGIWSQSVLARNLAHVTHESLVNLRLPDPALEIERAQPAPVTLTWAPRLPTEPYATIPAKKPGAVAALALGQGPSPPGLEVKAGDVPPLEAVKVEPPVQPGLGLGGAAPSPAKKPEPPAMPFSFFPFAQTTASAIGDLTETIRRAAAQQEAETKRALQETKATVAAAEAQVDTTFASASREFEALAAEVKAAETKSAAGREEAKVLDEEGKLIQQGSALLDQLRLDYAAYLEQSSTVAAYLRLLLPQLTQLAVLHQGVETKQELLREFVSMPEARQAITHLLPTLTGSIADALRDSNVGQRETMQMVNDLATAVKAFGIKMDRENADATSADRKILREDARAFRRDIGRALQLDQEERADLAAGTEWKEEQDEPQPGQAPLSFRRQPFIRAVPGRPGRPGPGQAPVAPSGPTKAQGPDRGPGKARAKGRPVGQGADRGPGRLVIGFVVTKVEQDVTLVVDKIRAGTKPSLDDWHTLLVDGLHLDFDANQGKWALMYALVITKHLLPQYFGWQTKPLPGVYDKAAFLAGRATRLGWWTYRLLSKLNETKEGCVLIKMLGQEIRHWLSQSPAEAMCSVVDGILDQAAKTLELHAPSTTEVVTQVLEPNFNILFGYTLRSLLSCQAVRKLDIKSRSGQTHVYAFLAWLAYDTLGVLKGEGMDAAQIVNVNQFEAGIRNGHYFNLLAFVYKYKSALRHIDYEELVVPPHTLENERRNAVMLLD